MLRTEVRRCVVAEVDLTAGVPSLADLEEAALEFARTAPALMIAETIQGLVGGLFDAVIGPFGCPLADEDQPPAPWACTGCGSVRGFRRRGLRPGGRGPWGTTERRLARSSPAARDDHAQMTNGSSRPELVVAPASPCW